MVQVSTSNQVSPDQEGAAPPPEGRRLEESSEDKLSLDEQTSGLYETMMSFLDLPDQEELPLDVDNSAWPAPDNGEEADSASNGYGDGALFPDGGIQSDTEKAVKFSKLRPELSQQKVFIREEDLGSIGRQDDSASPDETSGYESSPRLSRDSCSKPDSGSPESGSPRLQAGVQDWRMPSSRQSAPTNVIRFSMLREEFASQQGPLPGSAGKEGGKRDEKTRAEQNPGSGETAGFPARAEQPGENRESSLFAGADVFSEADLSSAADRAKREAAEIYESVVGFLKETFEEVSAGNPVSIDRAASIVLGVVNSSVSRDEWSQMIGEVSYSSDSKDFLIYHHANVTIFSICLGITLQLGKEELCRIGVIALLHDIGKMLIPDEILFKKGKPTPEEWKVLRQYPYESYKILSSLGPKYEVLAQCTLQVNERIDGSGSPRGLKAEAIHGYAQMIGLVDVYEAMTSNRPYRPKLSHYDAVKEILKTRKSSFARNFITALLKSFSIFPLGSHVRLNSGVIGSIIEVNKELPLRPKIEVHYDAAGMPLAVPFIVDLASQSFLYIQAPVPESELPSAG